MSLETREYPCVIWGGEGGVSYLHHGDVLLGWCRLDFARHFYNRLYQAGDILVHFII